MARRVIPDALGLLKKASMIKSKIKIAGKDVNVAWCYATEIAFHNYTGLPVEKFNINDPTHVLYLIIASVFAYYNATGAELPIEDADIMNDATPPEIAGASLKVTDLQKEWIKEPESDDSQKEDAGEENEKKQ